MHKEVQSMKMEGSNIRHQTDATPGTSAVSLEHMLDANHDRQACHTSTATGSASGMMQLSEFLVLQIQTSQKEYFLGLLRKHR